MRKTARRMVRYRQEMFRKYRRCLFIGLAIVCTVLVGKAFKNTLSPVRPIRLMTKREYALHIKSHLTDIKEERLPVLVLKNNEHFHPYYLSPMLQFKNDVHRRRSKFNLTGVEELFSGKHHSEKLIVYYNLPRWHTMESRYKNSLKNCRIQGCKFTDDKSLLPKADAVIFFVLDIGDVKPPPKPANQMWIFFAHEAPWNFPRWNGLFNWTMTFRFDSDIVCPYHVLTPKPEPDLRDFIQIAADKSKPVMWLVSHCNARSKRDNYVKELTKYIPVDIYGGCGPLTCPSNGSNSCDNIQTTTYKFYLAFENSLCRGYVTEKLFRCYTLDIVPVVRGGSRYADILPKGTYINTADFATPQKLAEYLQYLDSNATEYAGYLRRKSQFTITHPDSTLDSSICDICVKLHDLDRFANTYYDVNKWWSADSCQDVTDI